MGAPRKAATRDLSSEVAFLTRALKAPTLRESVARLAERARAESWTHEEFLVACLQREVSARDSLRRWVQTDERVAATLWRPPAGVDLS